MQVTVKLRGLLKIILFFAVIAASVSYVVYKAWRYYYYREIISETTAKRIKNFQPLNFAFAARIKDTIDKGYLLLTPCVRFNLKYGKMVIMDLAGNVRYKKEYIGALSDFRQWNLNGQLFYTYGIDDSSAMHLTLSGGHFVLLDSSLHEIKQIHLLPHNDISTDKHEDLDLHDIILFSPDHYITMAVYQKTVDNIPVYLTPAANNKIATTIIQEVNDGKVTWQWDGSKFPEFYFNSELGNHFYDTTAPQDYMHANSMALDPRDSNIILSLRHLNQVIKINRRTGDIMWRLGGKNSDFPISTEQVFLRQHSTVFGEDHQSLLVFDNGEKTARPWSRILEFKLDEQKKVITSFKSLRLPRPFSETRGSAEQSGDDYVVSGGSANYVMIINRITGQKKMELKANQSFYRAYLVKDIKGIDLGKQEK
jgi:arylsulfate sulfotransferase